MQALNTAFVLATAEKQGSLVFIPKKIAILFARHEESRAFRRRLRLGRHGGLAGHNIEVMLFHIGIGPAAARRAMQKIIPAILHAQCDRVIMAGFAGGLDPALALGSIVIARLPGHGVARIISREWPVETPAAKAALHRETGAQAVDMETATIDSECASAGLRGLAIRAISDPADTALPVPFSVWFHLAKQRPRPLSLAAHLLIHPGKIAPFFRFVHSLRLVGEALATAIESEIRAH